MRWWSDSRGVLFLVADITGGLLKVALPMAWGLVFPDTDGVSRIAWLAVAALYLVHSVTISTAVRREQAAKKVVQVTTINGTLVNPEDAEKIQEMMDEARTRRGSSIVQ